jgi:hypothetical protein
MTVRFSSLGVRIPAFCSRNARRNRPTVPHLAYNHAEANMFNAICRSFVCIAQMRTHKAQPGRAEQAAPYVPQRVDENSVAAVIPAKLDVGLAAEAVVDVPRSHMGECGAGSVDDDAAVRSDCVPATHGTVHVHNYVETMPSWPRSWAHCRRL